MRRPPGNYRGARCALRRCAVARRLYIPPHAVNTRSHTGQYADVYHLRDGKITAHWHLAVDPKADAEAASELFAS